VSLKERIEDYLDLPRFELAKKLVDLEDEFALLAKTSDDRMNYIVKSHEDEMEKSERLWRDREKENGELFDKLMKAENKLDSQELDPSRLESTLRMYVSELDYDIHKNLEYSEWDGLDHYPEEVEFFLRCWETAGEEN
jgi:hypothetical protein